MKKVLALLILAVLVVASAFAVRDLLRPYRGYSRRILVEIPSGTRALEVSQMLASQGVLAHRWPFLALYAAGRLRRRRLEAGEYLFDRPLRPLDVYRKLIHGEVYLHTVVIPEGSDRFDMARIFQKDLGLPPEEFLHVTGEAHAIRDLDPQAPNLEGYLFPDTYRFPRSATAANIIASMLNQFRRVYERDLASDLKQSGLTLHDAVTLASMVERETPNPGERPVIAQVFELRLQKGMALECDPTVIYAALIAGSPIQVIKQSDLKLDSPYNTYLNPGLPPGPICSPGEASLRAVLHPAASDFLYFVSNGHGGHVFARTLAEHRRNVARYRREMAALSGSSAENKNLPDPTKPGQHHRPKRRSARRPGKKVTHAQQEANHS